MSDAKRKEKRLLILSQIDSILKLCHCRNTHLKETCEHCAKVRPLGEQLNSLSKPRRIIRSDGTVVAGTVKERAYKFNPKNFTVEDYVRAKINKCSDDKFAISVTMSKTAFYKWKKANIDEIDKLMAVR